MYNLSWNEENDQMIETLFSSFVNNYASLQGRDKDKIGVELYVTATCNQKCEYCYLTKHGDKLYPVELRDQDTIIHNLKMLLSYFLKKEYKITSFDIFSGEIWASDFGITILELLLEYTKTTPYPPADICIPSNCSFILNDEYFEKIQIIIDGFQYYNTRLFFSASIDGPVLEAENRPFNDSSKNALRNEAFYTKLFDFCSKNNFGFHPMVNAHSIEKWPEQYDWWIAKLKEYNFGYFSHIMFLEVRNNEWTDDKIEKYLYFLNHAYEAVKKEIFNGDSFKLLQTCFNMKLGRDDAAAYNYFHLRLAKTSVKMGCTVDREVMIRLGDLSWVPCHRTSYEKFKYGEFKVENDEIVGMKALNLPLLFAIYGLGSGGHPKCDVCSLNSICIRGCYGAQFETHQELFYPCDTVCELLKAKSLFLYHKLKQDNPDLTDEECLIYFENMQPLVETEEVVSKWMPTVQKLLT